MVGGLKNAAIQGGTIVLSMYATRMLANKIVPMIPGVDKLGVHKGPATAALMVVIMGAITSKVGALKRFRAATLTGTSISLADQLIRAYAPDSVKKFIGLESDEGVYDEALGDYVQTAAYEQELGMGDYVETAAFEQELGDMSQGQMDEELGAEEELGDYVETAGFGDAPQLPAHLPRGVTPGAFGRGHMLAAVPKKKFIAPVPQKSFIKQVPEWSSAWDQKGLYSGIFGK